MNSEDLSVYKQLLETETYSSVVQIDWNVNVESEEVGNVCNVPLPETSHKRSHDDDANESEKRIRLSNAMTTDIPIPHNECNENNNIPHPNVAKKTKRVCSVSGCTSTHLDYVSFHSFPMIIVKNSVSQENVKRCKAWVQKSGNVELTMITTVDLNKTNFICSKHFGDNQYYNEKRKRLLQNAVPTLHLPAPLSDIEMGLFPVFGHRLDVFAAPLETHNIPNPSDDMDRNLIEPNFIENNNSVLQPLICAESVLNVKDKFYKAFTKDMNDLKEHKCPRCKEKFWCRRILKNPCLHNNNCTKFSLENNMDPGPIPEELRDLSYMEEQLISRVHPFLIYFKIKGHQYGYRGNVINFSQDVTALAKQLPHKITDMSSLITVKSKGANDKPREFHVRAGKVRNALLWLKRNNIYYEDIEISEENLELLPVNGNVMDSLSAIEVEDQECNEDDSIEGELTRPHISEGCVPLNISSNQNEQVKRKLDDVTNENESDQDVLTWPPLSKEPLNEFNTPGYICQAFPCLFPYGKADLRDNRQTKVNPSDYFKHLLRYEDGRFAQHTRFRFFAMNSLMRWSAIEKGNLYVNKHSDMKNMNVEELKEKVKENPSLVDSIMFQCSNVRGSKTYWKSKSKELLEMIEQLGMPTVFFTLSAADFHWPGLFKLLCPEENLSTISEKKRADLIAKNPLLVDQYFSERINSFLNKVLKPKFEAVDYWYRIEYQHRGSPHVHGLMWLKGAPDITDLSKKSDEDIREIIEYFDTLISSTNPNVNAPPAVVHPCRIELEDVIDLKKDLAELLNRVQRHTKCTEGYCIKKTGCRFKFPRELREFSEIQFKENGEPEFVPKRNDERLNKYNPYIILLWRANMDIAPVLSKQALVNYLAKYVSKHEVKSQSMQGVFKEVCESSNSNAKNAIQKLYIKACSDRDYSAQEVGHIIMSEKLVSSSRSFVSLYLPKEENWVPLNENVRDSKSLVQKYSERNQQLYGNKSLWYMTKWFDFQHKRIRSNHVIVVVFPKIKFKENQERNEEFYRMKVLLHVPWTSMNQFENENLSWEQLYKDNIDVIKKEETENVNNLGGIDIDVEEVLNDDDFENGDVPYRTTTEDHMIISSMLPGQNVAAPEIGRRYLDTVNDWNSSIQNYPNYTIEELENFLASNKADFQNVAEIPDYPNVQFNSDQMTVITLIEKHITNITNAENSDIHLPKSVVVQGPAGTGKSLVIRAVTNRIMTALGVRSILLLAPTGVAAVNIGGSTIHSKLHISNINDFEDLRNEAARKFCNEMKDIKVIVIDEYSMVGCAMMAAIDRRLKQSSGNYNALFGGYIVLFFGDVYQLPPVKDTPLYSEVIPQNPAKLHGKFVFSEIESAIFLRKVHRQSDPQFRSVLDRISRGKVIEEDYTYLKTRFLLNVSSDERKDFKDAIRLFPTKPLVQKHNIDYLTSLRHCVTNEPVPIAIIPAKHNCPKAESGSIDDASGLSSSLVLGLTCKIMLRCNLWTEQGLVNGAVGIIIDIIYRPEERPPVDMPAVLICKFEDYKGPFLNNDNDKKLVPIIPMSKSWTTKCGVSCTRTNFPIQVAAAFTIHKSQGLTLLKAKIDIGEEKEMCPGLSFVALSRVKSFQGLLLESFSKKRFFKINSSSVMQLKQKCEGALLKKSLN